MRSPVAPWPLDRTVLPSGWDPDALSEAQATVLAVASEILWLATAKTYGLVLSRYRPPSAPVPQAVLRGRYGVAPGYGCLGPPVYGPWCAGIAGGLCGCLNHAVTVPGPVQEVLSVRVGGAALDPSAYRTDGRRVYRADGQTWPLTQAVELPDDQPGTWSITYQRGVIPPAGGARAVTILAVELARWGTTGCRLPERVQTISREGVSFTMIDPLDFLDAGRTGLVEVDRWLAMVNPGGAREQPAFLSPESLRG